MNRQESFELCGILAVLSAASLVPKENNKVEPISLNFNRKQAEHNTFQQETEQNQWVTFKSSFIKLVY